jgi:hypothetical protein
MQCWQIQSLTALSTLIGSVLVLELAPVKAQSTGSPTAQANIEFVRVTTDSTVTDVGGTCQGGVYVPRTVFTLGTHRSNSRAGHFLSKTTPPGPGLRVVLRNVTPGMNPESIPYVDLAYAGLRSQQLIVQRGTSQNPSYLAVVPGKNVFNYIIKRDDQVLETGTFSAQIEAESLIPAGMEAAHEDYRAAQRDECAAQYELDEQKRQAQEEKLRQQQQVADKQFQQELKQQQQTLQQRLQEPVPSNLIPPIPPNLLPSSP